MPHPRNLVIAFLAVILFAVMGQIHLSTLGLNYGVLVFGSPQRCVDLPTCVRVAVIEPVTSEIIEDVRVTAEEATVTAHHGESLVCFGVPSPKHAALHIATPWGNEDVAIAWQDPHDWKLPLSPPPKPSKEQLEHPELFLYTAGVRITSHDAHQATIETLPFHGAVNLDVWHDGCFIAGKTWDNTQTSITQNVSEMLPQGLSAIHVYSHLVGGDDGATGLVWKGDGLLHTIDETYYHPGSVAAPLRIDTTAPRRNELNAWVAKQRHRLWILLIATSGLGSTLLALWMIWRTVKTRSLLGHVLNQPGDAHPASLTGGMTILPLAGAAFAVGLLFYSVWSLIAHMRWM